MIAASGIAIIPSAPRTLLIPSAPITSSRIPTGLISSAPRPPGIIPSAPSTVEEPSLAGPPATASEERPSSLNPPAPPIPTGIIPSAPISSIHQPLDSTSTFPTLYPTPINGTGPVSATNVAPTLPILPPGMTSTLEGLHPIPAPTTDPGDPDGHHEIPEPDYTVTLPCRGCSPVVEISATGWESIPTFPVDIPPAQEQNTKASTPSPVAPAVTLSAGPSDVIVKPDPSSGGGFIIGDGATVKPGQTVTVGGNTPIAVHTSNGHTDVVIGGTQTVPLTPPSNPPIATITAGPSPIVVKPAPSSPNFLIGDATVSPGQTLTLSNTPIVVQTDTSRTLVVINGTQTIPLLPLDITDAPIHLPITLAPGLVATPIAPTTLNADPTVPVPAGYILASHTLLPGGPPLTLSGTAYALAPAATAFVVNGYTTTLAPAYGSLLTSVSAAPLTLWGRVYTANRAGYYSLAPGTTLVPGGPAVTVGGSVISLEPEGTAAVVGGVTSAVGVVTAVVTVVRSTRAPDVGTGVGAGKALPTVREGGGSMLRVEGVVLLGFILVGGGV
ncbi:hypothetical protein BU23DRAFT_272400 [Bimuria novae-zelandiae CBS 107.79]|uniref:Uncharacterized protein n=1 Tax=Bimuria novae-zelandiae CBS 107.79 TaxID=1447943 RepID=A0A6A5VKI4_9PLEO|nr:hypothetical protein BU23DRAFT_272400 [Bimuria novae-zelandiae CBS 107.79]